MVDCCLNHDRNCRLTLRHLYDVVDFGMSTIFEASEHLIASTDAGLLLFIRQQTTVFNGLGPP